MTAPTSSYATSSIESSDLYYIDALLYTEKWGGQAGAGVDLSYSFPWTTSSSASFNGLNGSSTYSDLNEPTADSHYGLNAVQQAAVRDALHAWASVADISFAEISESAADVGDLRIAWTSVPNGSWWGWSSFPSAFWPNAGDVWLNSNSTGASQSDWSSGSYNYEALIHELGHSLGLKHSFEGTATLPAAEDTTQYSLMSYTNHAHSLYVEVTTNADGSHTWRSYDVSADTPMLYDIAAIQYLYGANLAYRTGSDAYYFDPGTPFFRTLWDAGGTDTISAAGFRTDCVIDLRPGHFSSLRIEPDSTSGIDWNTAPPTSTYDGTDNLAIAFGCIIENVYGGSGSDRVTGNDVANTLTGAAGDDTLDGGAGADTADFSGNASAYTVSLASDGSVTVSGTDGTDVLSHIEKLSFDDATLSLIDALPAVQFTSERHAAKVQAYFLGVLGREATTTEASQFTALLQSNQSRVWWYDAAQTTMDGSLMSYLIAQPEYTTLVANPNATIVSTVYGRLTGQSAPQALIDHYVNRIEAGTLQARGIVNKLLGELYLSPTGDGTLGGISGFQDNRSYLDGTSLRGYLDRLDAVAGIDLSNLDAEGNLVGIVGVA